MHFQEAPQLPRVRGRLREPEMHVEPHNAEGSVETKSATKLSESSDDSDDADLQLC